MYTCLVKNNLRDDLVLYLRSKSIEASVHFDPPLHKQKYCKNFVKMYFQIQSYFLNYYELTYLSIS